MTNGSLMKVESIAECSLGAFCNTLDLHQAIIGLEKLVFFLSGRLKQVLLYCTQNLVAAELPLVLCKLSSASKAMFCSIALILGINAATTGRNVFMRGSRQFFPEGIQL